MNAYITQIRMSLRLAMRNRVALLFGYMFPLLFFIIYGQLGAARGGAAVQVVNMALGMGVIGSGLFGAGFGAVMQREQNILRRFKVAPIGPAPILVSGMVTGFIQQVPMIVLIIVLAHQLYGMPWPANPFSLLAFVVLGYAAFAAIGGMVAAVVNSMQESQLIIQILYFAMLFLGGTTFPISIMPNALQIVAQFIPTTYFSTALQPILRGEETFFNNLMPAGALLLTAIVGTFLGLKLFRWEKEEKMRPTAKLWVLAVLGPFLAMGLWQLHAKDNVEKIRAQDRAARRGRTTLVRNTRLFVGDGSVIERGSVLLKNGKIAEVFQSAPPDAKSLLADDIDGSGKTLLPGLIDTHVHLGAPGGIYVDAAEYANVDPAIDRELAAYLFSGVTAVKSLGDMTDTVLAHRDRVNSGVRLGAELFAVGPLFTTQGGHGFEIIQQVPESIRPQMLQQFVRVPKTPDEARAQVDALKGVNGIKVVLEAGGGSQKFPRMEVPILKAIVDAAHARGLPVAAHTGSARDVADAVDAGVEAIEHGPFWEKIPDETFVRMKEKHVAYDPTLTEIEAIQFLGEGKTTPLDRSLVEQVGPAKLLEQTKRTLTTRNASLAASPLRLETAKQNLMAAYRAGVTLTAGTDSGNMLVIHGPAIHREMQLWVAAGIPAAAALQAATLNNAKLLRAEDRIGSIQKGREASVLLVDGNPLQDISATEHISLVFFKGEPIIRQELFKQD